MDRCAGITEHRVYLRTMLRISWMRENPAQIRNTWKLKCEPRVSFLFLSRTVPPKGRRSYRENSRAEGQHFGVLNFAPTCSCLGLPFSPFDPHHPKSWTKELSLRRHFNSPAFYKRSRSAHFQQHYCLKSDGIQFENEWNHCEKSVSWLPWTGIRISSRRPETWRLSARFEIFFRYVNPHIRAV